jgi:creatinine amidohydrolase/Fe(II)-dependent formamide hydrolase-like protein
VGHASRIETAVMQALHPETVRLDKLPPLSEPLRNADWAVIDYETFLGKPTPERIIHDHDDPRNATAKQGHLTIQRAVDQIAKYVNEELKRLSD